MRQKIVTVNRRFFACRNCSSPVPHPNLATDLQLCFYLIAPHATSCGGYNAFDQSVSQSVRQSCFSCQRNSSETARQNFLKLCSYEGHYVQMRISTGNFDSTFFSELRPFLTQKLGQNLRYYSTQFVSATPLKPINRIS